MRRERHAIARERAIEALKPVTSEQDQYTAFAERARRAGTRAGRTLAPPCTHLMIPEIPPAGVRC